MKGSNRNINVLHGNSFDMQDMKNIEYRNKWNENPINNIVERFPLHLDIEITNHCNLKCGFCASTVYNYAQRGYMDWSIYKKIIDEGAEKGLYALKLNWRGEPLLHEKVVEMVKYARQKGIHDVFINTNGYYLNEEMSKNLIKAGLSRIIFSFEGYTKDVYEKYRVGSNFEKVVQNIRRFSEVKKELNVINPKIRIQTVNVPEISGNESKYQEFWSEWADEVTVIDIRDERKDFTDVIEGQWHCPYLWLRLTIGYDGTVHPCCFVTKDEKNYDGGEKLGNVCNSDIETIWKSTKIQEYRYLHKRGLSDQVKICSKCSYRGTDISKNLSSF